MVHEEGVIVVAVGVVCGLEVAEEKACENGEEEVRHPVDGRGRHEFAGESRHGGDEHQADQADVKREPFRGHQPLREVFARRCLVRHERHEHHLQECQEIQMSKVFHTVLGGLHVQVVVELNLSRAHFLCGLLKLGLLLLLADGGLGLLDEHLLRSG